MQRKLLKKQKKVWRKRCKKLLMMQLLQRPKEKIKKLKRIKKMRKKQKKLKTSQIQKRIAHQKENLKQQKSRQLLIEVLRMDQKISERCGNFMDELNKLEMNKK